MRLKGKRILVTGAASGIGAASARLFAAEGAVVAMLDRQTPTDGDPAAAVFRADVTDEAAATQAVDEAARRLGGLDGLAHCAGIATTARLEATSIATWRQILDVNLTGSFIVCKAAIPHLRRSPAGAIATIASASGLLPSIAGGAYGASKAGVDMLMKYLARELAPGIRVNSVCPGTVDTPMAAAIVKDIDPDAAAAAIRSTYALQRMAKPEEIAEALLWLLSDASSYVTGVSLAVDGGRTFH